MVGSNDIKEFIGSENLRGKIMTAEEAAMFVKPDMTIGFSGFTPSGYPKVVSMAVAKRAEKEGPIPLTVWSGASAGPELDGELVRTGCMKRRYPYQTDDAMRKGINKGEIMFADIHLSHCSQNIRYGFFGKMDIAVIEAIEVRADGGIVPTTSVGNCTAFIEMADKVIVELNTAQPRGLNGMHDVYSLVNPPHRKPIPIVNVRDRVGTTYLPCPPEKIVAIVPSDIGDSQRPLAPVDEVSAKMASNLIDFLSVEVKAGRLPKELLPLQSGVGNIANAVLVGLNDWPTDGLTVYTEVLQDAVFDLLDSGKVSFASSTALTPSPEAAAKFYPRIGDFKDRIVLRPQEISNNPELIRRLGVIAMNTAVEVDIYGHVNSTMAAGTKMLNGIGGSGDFARNAYLTAFLCPSTSAGGKISKVVPFCSHIDHTEHDVDIIVTEYGIADLRGLCPRERSREIIQKCCHPDYRELLADYAKRAETGVSGHEPHILSEAFSWHDRLIKTGTMKP